MPRGRTKDLWLVIGAFAAIGAGVLGLTAQRVLIDNPSPTPSVRTTTAPAITGTTPTPSGGPVSAASLTIVEPSDNATASGSLVVRVDVRGFRVVPQGRPANVPGEGHLIYYRDVDFVPTRAGSAARTEPGTFAASSELTHTWSELTPGSHALFVQLVNNDDTPLSPPVVDSVVVTVTAVASPSVGPSPQASPSPPASA